MRLLKTSDYVRWACCLAVVVLWFVFPQWYGWVPSLLVLVLAAIEIQEIINRNTQKKMKLLTLLVEEIGVQAFHTGLRMTGGPKCKN